uniref:Uncharacterized protein n=1 Tax=Proboscia inermis TaxID=420281 RepID=A0A7S0CH69_9STRA|mmetsp:Transcript_46973/g.47427  ORF Transcript_46973/g.47427 Transcript_46973/m.47427 type:complete len:145 (+) Transcript_46973:94-528(+)|eukprot:CAMPEP_0171315622 /NCGR_PEP_ID=MMETSP0816-20121228/65775_1 /TAXON_ID=420281 /ORGANISM="Proboscia inermis, Strain CCAP1064/1" /LENGTH=144 /DNA_ID=CAMNT_0011806469 /DNA_START=64 /DNA_END=498 /DNA_ORIENTATION=+
MSLKKRKKATASSKENSGNQNTTFWLLIYEKEGRDCPERQEGLYSTKEKAVAAVPAFMNEFAGCGDDWMGGVEGFGKEDEDVGDGFEYFGEDVLKKTNINGGILLSNTTNECASNRITVRLKCMQIDLPDSNILREEEPGNPYH